MVKISEKTNVTFDIKTIIILITMVVAISTTFFTLQAGIEEAKNLPKPTLSPMEWQIKDELIRTTIMNNAERLEKIEIKIDKIDEKLYNLNK